MSSVLTVDGRLRLMSNNRTIVLTFCGRELYRLIQHTKIPAIAVRTENNSEVRIVPAKAKTNLYADGGMAYAWQ
jgi:hypothetical protein